MDIHTTKMGVGRRNHRSKFLIIAAFFVGTTTGATSATNDPWANASELRWRVRGVTFARNGEVFTTYEYYNFRRDELAQKRFPKRTIATVTGIIDKAAGLLNPLAVVCHQRISSAIMSRDRDGMAFGIYAVEDMTGPSNSSLLSPFAGSLKKGNYGVWVVRSGRPEVMVTIAGNRPLEPAGLSMDELWSVANTKQGPAIVRHDLNSRQVLAFNPGVFAILGIQNIAAGKFLVSSVGLQNVEIIDHIAKRMKSDPREIATHILVYEFDAANSKLTLHHISDYLDQDKGFGRITNFSRARQAKDGSIFVTARHGDKFPNRYVLYRYKNGSLDPIQEIPGVPGEMAVSDDGEWIAFGHSAPTRNAGRVEVVEGLSFLNATSHQLKTYDLGKDRYLRPAKDICPH